MCEQVSERADEYDASAGACSRDEHLEARTERGRIGVGLLLAMRSSEDIGGGEVDGVG